jgi:hypothetical protein
LLAVGVLAASAPALSLVAQIDPERRELIQVAYNQSLQEQGPIAGYAFYYLNVPDSPATNQTLRLAVAPVYLDGELGFRHVLGEETDLGLGVAGGGFADSFAEVRGGRYIHRESFTGHGTEISSSLYHLFNRGARVPLNGILRGKVTYSLYERDSDTAKDFELPDDLAAFHLRAGLRYGGVEPLMAPPLAMELSCWYEGQIRGDHGPYGFHSTSGSKNSGDRRVNPNTHLFWGRALLDYTVPNWGHYFSLSLTAGTSLNADRFSAYRLGAVLPLGSEFPLNLPGYYYQEISARQFALLSGLYSLPLDDHGRWTLAAFGATAIVDYLPGMEQPGDWHSGLGGGIGFRSANKAWQCMVGYAYGVDAIRDGERGAHTVGILAQVDLEARRRPSTAEPAVAPMRSRGLFRLFRN